MLYSSVELKLDKNSYYFKNSLNHVKIFNFNLKLELNKIPCLIYTNEKDSNPVEMGLDNITSRGDILPILF